MWPINERLREENQKHRIAIMSSHHVRILRSKWIQRKKCARFFTIDFFCIASSNIYTMDTKKRICCIRFFGLLLS